MRNIFPLLRGIGEGEPVARGSFFKTIFPGFEASGRPGIFEPHSCAKSLNIIDILKGNIKPRHCKMSKY